MRLSCTVCYELFIPTDDVHAARCGHILHYKCWAQWLQRSQNCPDCRKQTHLPELFKLFFNIGEGDDYSTLSNKYDALRCDLSCKVKDCEAAEKKLKLLEKEKLKLQQDLQKLKTENEELRKGKVVAGGGADTVKVGLAVYDTLVKNSAEAQKTMKSNKELAEEITRLKKKAQDLEKKKGKNDNSKKYSESEMMTMRRFEDIVRHMKNALTEYEDLKKNHQFLKSLKVYTDQVDSTTDLWNNVDDEPAKYVELFKDVKRFLDQKEKREEELNNCPRGCVLELSGIPKSMPVSWHDIREAVESFDVDVAFVTYNPGDEVAFVRLEQDFDNQSPAIMVANRLHGLRIAVSGLSLKLRPLRGKEETDFLRRSLEARDQRNRERFRRRKGYEDRDEGSESFLDICMRMVAEANPKEKVVAYCLSAYAF